MRIRKLSLDFFGRFSGHGFDFGEAAGGSDFHLIHGPNEAGKTTTMEGYLRLLYGFPHREPYDYLHERKNLRVSGVLETDEGLVRLTRLPRRAGSLLDAAGKPVPEQAIAAHLGGLSLSDYRNLLCLDDQTIESGGEEIANARGDIGRLLFSAAAGLADLNAILEQTREEAGGLFRKRAQKTRMARLKRELAEVERKLRDRDVSASSWRRAKEALQGAMAEEAAAREQRDDLRGRLARLEARARALPLLREHERLERDLEAWADYPEHLDFNPEELVELKTRQARLEAEVERLRARIGKARAARAGITIAPERLALTGKLEELDELRNRAQGARLDVPRRKGELRDVMARMARAARELGASRDVDPCSLVKSAGELESLDNAHEAMRAAAQALEAQEQAVADLERQLGAARESHEAARARAEQDAGVGDLLARFDADALAPAVARAKEALAAAGEHFDEALAGLAVGGREFAQLPGCPLAPAAARALAEDHAACVEKIGREADALARLRERADALAARMAEISADAGIVPDAAAEKAREERDALWRAHRESLSPQSAGRFEAAMRKVDEIAALRLAHARELGELRQLAQERAEARARIESTQERLAALRDEAGGMEERAARAAAEAGLVSMTPAALADWVEKLDKAGQARRKLERLRKRHGPVLERAERLLAALRPLLDLDAPHLAPALAAARRLASEERAHGEELAAARAALSDRQGELKRQRERLEELQRVARETAANWEKLVEMLFQGRLAPGNLAKARAALRELREMEAGREQIAGRIAAMEEDQAQFARAVRELAERHGVEGTDPLEVFDALQALAGQAREEKARALELEARMKEDAEARKVAREGLAEIDRQVRAHGALFPGRVATDGLDALRAAASKAQEVIGMRKRLAELERLFRTELSVADIDAARRELADVSGADLEARRGALKQDIENAEARLSGATEARVNAQRDLRAITGDEDAAMLAERQASLQMRIEETALDYLELDLGLALAEEAIRRYRDAHRSQMLEAAERAFRDLTMGAYETLRTQPEGASEILLAVDGGGAARRVADLSKGTRFQLYLALRAAAYEQMSAQGIRLPFFCDDIFETFDEDRTRAACLLMERIGRTGQAIYLTHHQHVVDIAREVCQTPPRVHELN